MESRAGRADRPVECGPTPIAVGVKLARHSGRLGAMVNVKDASLDGDV